MSKQAVLANNRIVSGKTVTETELLVVESARANVAWLKSQIADAERNLADLEADIVAKLEAGFSVRSRNLTAAIQETVGARRPEWKDLYLAHMEDEHGKPRKNEEQRVLAMTAGKPSQKLVILHKGK